MGRFKLAVVGLLLLVGGLFAGILLLAPALILLPIANSMLDDFGYELGELVDFRLGSASSLIGNATLVGENLQLSVHEIGLAYSLTGLMRGQLQSLHIDEINLTLIPAPSDTASSNSTPSVAEMLQVLDRIPIDAVSIDSILLKTDDETMNLDLAVKTNPLILEGDAIFNGARQLKIAFRAQRSGSNSFEASSSLYVDDRRAIDSELTLSVLQQNIDVDARSRIDVAGIMSLAALSELPASTVILTDTLLLETGFTLADPFDTPSIQALTLSLDNPSSTLHFKQQSDLGENEFQIQLPLSLAAESASLESGIKLSASDISASGSWLNESAEFTAESTLSNTQLSCSTVSNCEFTTHWDYGLTNWKFGAVSGENLGVTGAVNINFAKDELHLASPSLALAIPAIKTASSNSAIRLLLEDLDFKIGDSLLGGFSFTSTELAPDIPFINFGQSLISGRLNVEDDVLIGIVEIDLNQQLKMGIALQHFFLRDYGDAEIQLAPLEFSPAAPLSSLLDLPALNADIMAGQIAGHSNVSWSRQPDRRWEFGGPVIVNLQNLGGVFNEVLFQDLSTAIFAEATTPWGIRTNTPQSATIARIDLGLPVQNISWQYSLDSQKKQFQIDQFNSELLGGNVAVAHMDFQADREQNALPVVISNLDLNSIVSLADYPELVVDGLISGYLPLLLRGDKITVEEGLVGALKPGGSIRYTPSNTLGSSNSSVQLVNDALSNYHFETMNTEVFYDESGDLRMEVQLQGSNPDMNEGQAINLNVNITDNIPTLLRSLQASRVITDELELILQKQ
jgi:hypothetical protein